MGLLNLVRMTTVTTGTGTVTLGSAVQGFLTVAQAGGVNGATYSYAIEADYVTVGDELVASSREVGTGVYTSSGTTFSRSVISSTNSDALLNLAGDAQIIITPNAADAAVGRHTVGAAAGTLFPATTNGCAALAQAETATNKINYKYLAFDAAAVEYAWFAIPTPKSYNASTVLMRAVWTHPATTTNFGVVWQFEILSSANDDALDTAVGTAVTVTDTGGTTQDFYQADVSAVITPSATPAKQDWLFVRVSRLATSGSDTMAVDAHLIGVELYYTTDVGTDT